MKQKLEKATHKTFGIILALIAIPAVAALVVVWAAAGIGGRLADIITRGRRNEEKEESSADDI